MASFYVLPTTTVTVELSAEIELRLIFSAEKYMKQDAQLSQRDRVRFVSLNILLSHSRSLEMTLLRKACVSP